LEADCHHTARVHAGGGLPFTESQYERLLPVSLQLALNQTASVGTLVTNLGARMQRVHVYSTHTVPSSSLYATLSSFATVAGRVQFAVKQVGLCLSDLLAITLVLRLYLAIQSAWSGTYLNWSLAYSAADSISAGHIQRHNCHARIPTEGHGWTGAADYENINAAAAMPNFARCIVSLLSSTLTQKIMGAGSHKTAAGPCVQPRF
jgi:hypothetical protein